MKYSKINGGNFYNMVIHASNKLDEQKEFVNSLNVFPVPDGDTGTNMSMTFKASVKEIEGIDSLSIGEVSKKLAKGALMGARGNSGVILSQILRGISKGLEGKEEVDSKEFAKAIEQGAKAAYKAVMRPIEGTILTIIRAAGEAAMASKTSDIKELMSEVCRESQNMLNKTPEMLPVLKSAKVVDSGGMGLLIILKGMNEALENNIEATIQEFKATNENISAANNLNLEDIKFGYCTEFIIIGNAEKSNNFKNEIENLGDSMIVVGYEDVIKVHIHTNDPGDVLSRAVKYGELSKIKIDNMREEHRSLLVDDDKKYDKEIAIEDETKERKKYAFVSVAMGKGISNIFKDLGVDCIIEGGQTMNPSTEDIMKAVNSINADNVFILPNNKNIIMAANQAADLAEDKNVIVLATKTIPQGITAITMFNPESEVDENIESMKNSLETVKTGTVTFAVRDTEMDGKQIKEGNILGIVESKIQEVGEEVFETTKKIIESMVDEDSSLITLFYGEDVEEEKANEFASELEKNYDDLDVQCYKGEQPLYYFLVSVE